MKAILLGLSLLFSTAASAETPALDKAEGIYKGTIKGKKKTKPCFLKAGYSRDTWFELEAYRSEKERKKLYERKNVNLSGHKNYMEEKFQDEYNVHMRDVASDVSAMYAWMFGAEPKDYILEVETSNDGIPTAYEFYSERRKRKSIIICVKLKKI